VNDLKQSDLSLDVSHLSLDVSHLSLDVSHIRSAASALANGQASRHQSAPVSIRLTYTTYTFGQTYQQDAHQTAQRNVGNLSNVLIAP
jgi:hypothetical protein